MKEVKPLKNYTNDELLSFLYDNTFCDLLYLSSVAFEILRRMNERSCLLPKDEEKTDNKKIVDEFTFILRRLEPFKNDSRLNNLINYCQYKKMYYLQKDQ